MLKVLLGFVVSVVVLLSSAYVPGAYATSANVLITQIQAGGIGSPMQEFIVIYNNSPDEVDISGWCLTNKNGSVITCFTPSIGQAIYVPAYKHATVLSMALASSAPIGALTTTYVPISQSSGSITGGSDTISLIDSAGTIVDRQSWATALSAGMQFERHGSGSPLVYQDTDLSADWSMTASGVLPVDETEIYTVVVDDICPNLEGIQPQLPAGKEVSLAGDCIDKIVLHMMITEVLPNAAGSDEGREFIELFNPNDVAVSLADYLLLVGPNSENTYHFPEGANIQPHTYRSFSNVEMPFTLLNSSSLVRLTLGDGTVISDMPSYTDPKDDQSWAMINDEWRYTNQPTPGLVNTPSREAIAVVEAAVSLQPCAADQYRSLETNRCRLISTVVTRITPCKDGQYRSEETNRCRNIASDSKTITLCNDGEERSPDTNRCRKIALASLPAPCKEGQERNPDTNRCHTMPKMPSADYGVLGAETKSGGNWYVWATVGGALLLAFGYAIWEWHDEIGRFFRARFSSVIRFARFHK